MARIRCQRQWQEGSVINEARSCENLCSLPMKWARNKNEVARRTKSCKKYVWARKAATSCKQYCTCCKQLRIYQSGRLRPRWTKMQDHCTTPTQKRIGKKCYIIWCEICPNQMWNMSSHSCELCSGGLNKKGKQEAWDTWEEQKLSWH